MTNATYDELPALLSRLTGDEKHSAAALSTLDALWVLYDRVLRSGTGPDDPDRDRFLLSKGHGPMAYYAVLAAKGLLPRDWLDDLGGWSSRLGLHPDRELLPCVEISSGSLGHGLPLAVGMCLGLRLQERLARVVVMVGDGELDEGSNAEAIQVAGRLGLSALTAVVIDNGSASLGWPGGVAGRFAIEGWSVRNALAKDRDQLADALLATADVPTAVVVSA